jgi:hypothetical protein
VARGALARTLAMMAEANFAVRFGMGCSGDDTEHVASPISLKTWVAMRRNSGQHGA